MLPSAIRSRWAVLVFFLLFVIAAQTGCASRVVIGRARPAGESAPAQTAPAAQSKKPEAQKSAAAPAPQAQEKPKPKLAQGGGMGGMGGGMGTSKSAPLPTPSVTVPQSSPKPEVSSSGQKPLASSPYKLDLSFGGFGLGVGLFDTPVGVAVDENENIYVVDQGNYRIEKFDRFGVFQFAWGRQGMGDGEFSEQSVSGRRALRETGEFEFNKPIGILLDQDNSRNLIRIHVVDSLNHRIERFLLTQNQGETFPDFGNGNVFVMLTKSGVQPDAPPVPNSLEDRYKTNGKQVILDPLYLSDSPGKANPLMLSPFIWGGLGYTQGQLNMPSYIAKDENNIFYVSDTGNGRIEAFYVTPDNSATDATYYREFGNDINLPFGAGRLKEPTGIVYDNTGFGGFLVIDKLPGGTYNIQKFDRDGHFIGVFATSGDKEGQFKEPVSMAINTFDNTVFITDRAKRKVMVYNNKGQFMYEFGGEELEDPRGIAVLRNGYVYVTDAAKNMVYRYVPR